MSNLVTLDDGFKRNQIVTDSKITTAINNMTSTELKIFYQLVTLIKKDDSNFDTYTIGIKEFSKALNLNLSNRDFIRNTCMNLAKQIFKIDYENKDFLILTIFSKFAYSHSKQQIQIKFNEEMKPYLLQLKDSFTQIKQIKYIKAFDSKYAIRIYALLKDYRLMSQRKLNIDELSRILSLPTSYSNFKFINEKVLTPAIKEINSKSDIYISEIERVKTGRKITDIVIHYHNKSEQQLQDMINYLTYLYKKSGNDITIFYGKYFSYDEIKNSSEIVKITSIEVDERPYYTVKSGTATLFGILGKKPCVDKIMYGIYNAMSYIVESERQEKKDVEIWQEEKKTNKKMKELFKSWI